jgi:hypothetical protein
MALVYYQFSTSKGCEIFMSLVPLIEIIRTLIRPLWLLVNFQTWTSERLRRICVACFPDWKSLERDSAFYGSGLVPAFDLNGFKCRDIYSVFSCDCSFFTISTLLVHVSEWLFWLFFVVSACFSQMFSFDTLLSSVCPSRRLFAMRQSAKPLVHLVLVSAQRYCCLTTIGTSSLRFTVCPGAGISMAVPAISISVFRTGVGGRPQKGANSSWLGCLNWTSILGGPGWDYSQH